MLKKDSQEHVLWNIYILGILKFGTVGSLKLKVLKYKSATTWFSVQTDTQIKQRSTYGKQFYYLLCKTDILYIISDILYAI